MNKLCIYAAEMRKNPTKAEQRLLDALKVAGLEPVCQAVLHGFISDFYFHDVRLTIEIDGLSHDSKEQKERDRCKANVLRKHGINTIRFRNREVYIDVDDVVAKIELAIRKRKREIKRPNFKYGIQRNYRHIPRRPGSF